MKHVLMVLFVMLTVGCAPNSTLQSAPEQPQLLLQGGQPDDLVVINGQELGPLHRFQEPETLTIPVKEGTHLVSIIRNGEVVFEKKVYVDGNLISTIKIQ
ncbi:hypothetical protein [Ferrimonas balearica]|uniref:hypothetical protein n=1 Tax=Ferrimonas balearica TaxID=44012 RepID=UPI001C997A8C|nr:hypothetical protein [Ferrimonas balearica]MBY5923329.1 hypothetical protein [Ferrimonas balearica]MBY5995287.1 hypothetical protein [Ferrimonas balearica]